MPYFFNPDRIPVSVEDVFPEMGLLRRMMVERPIIVSDRELRRMSPQERRYFSHISDSMATREVGRAAEALQTEDDARQRRVFARQAASAQNIEAAQTVEMVQRALGELTPRQLRAAEEMANVTRRRRVRPDGTAPAPMHSNEGDIEPEDL